MRHTPFYMRTEEWCQMKLLYRYGISEYCDIFHTTLLPSQPKAAIPATVKSYFSLQQHRKRDSDSSTFSKRKLFQKFHVTSLMSFIFYNTSRTCNSSSTTVLTMHVTGDIRFIYEHKKLPYVIQKYAAV